MAETSILSESRSMLEYWQLQADPIYRGIGVAEGDGKLVLVLPGLFANDFYLQPMRTWLSRIGYKPQLSTLPINAGCPKRLAESVESTFLPKLDKHDGDIAIIGHSRGGMLGKAIASRLGGRVSHFIALGSPLGGMLRMGQSGIDAMAHNVRNITAGLASKQVVDAGRAIMQLIDPNCDSPTCGCVYMQDLMMPFNEKTKLTSIYSTTDPIVPAVASNLPGARNIEIVGTHSGLVFNRLVYPHIAQALAT